MEEHEQAQVVEPATVAWNLFRQSIAYEVAAGRLLGPGMPPGEVQGRTTRVVDFLQELADRDSLMRLELPDAMRVAFSAGYHAGTMENPAREQKIARLCELVLRMRSHDREEHEHSIEPDDIAEAAALVGEL